MWMYIFLELVKCCTSDPAADGYKDNNIVDDNDVVDAESVSFNHMSRYPPESASSQADIVSTISPLQSFRNQSNNSVSDRHSQVHQRRRNRLESEAKAGVAIVGPSQAWSESMFCIFDSFGAYADIMIQFGFVCLFSVTFPITPLFALLKNLVDMRAGAWKLCAFTKRPVARKASGVGVWLTVLQVMSVASILTNSALIGFTSSQFEWWFPGITAAQKIVALFVYEHILLTVLVIAQTCIDPIPSHVKASLQRDKAEIHKVMTSLMHMESKAKEHKRLKDMEDECALNDD
jgi:hypothetical protein